MKWPPITYGSDMDTQNGPSKRQTAHEGMLGGNTSVSSQLLYIQLEVLF